MFWRQHLPIASGRILTSRASPNICHRKYCIKHINVRITKNTYTNERTKANFKPSIAIVIRLGPDLHKRHDYQ